MRNRGGNNEFEPSRKEAKHLAFLSGFLVASLIGMVLIVDKMDESAEKKHYNQENLEFIDETLRQKVMLNYARNLLLSRANEYAKQGYVHACMETVDKIIVLNSGRDPHVECAPTDSVQLIDD